MAGLFESYHELIQKYMSYLENGETVFFVLMMLSIAFGAVIAFFNAKYHNIIPWLTVVLLFPLFGTFAAAAFILYIFRNSEKLSSAYLRLSPWVFIVPLICAGAAAAACVLFPDIDRSYHSDTLVVSTALLVLLIMLVFAWLKNNNDPVYFHVVKRNELSDEKEELHETYRCMVFPPETVPDAAEALRVSEEYLAGRCGNGRYGFRRRAIIDENEYLFDFYNESTYRRCFDVISAIQRGNGITEITALDWSVSHGLIAVDTARAAAEERKIFKPEYTEYNGEYVRKLVLFRRRKRFLPVAVGMAEAAAVFLLFLTPLGVNIHTNVLGAIRGILGL